MTKRKDARVIPAKEADLATLAKVPGRTLTPFERRRLERKMEDEELRKHEERKAKRTLPGYVRAIVFVMALGIGIDHYLPWEKLLRIGPGFSGRVPLEPGKVTSPQPVPTKIFAPSWGDPLFNGSHTAWNPSTSVHDENGIDAMRVAGDLASRALGVARDLIRVGVTTDDIDQAVHKFIIDNDAYPSPLKFKKFLKSVCTSVNEVMVHGVPDSRPLQEGDIINVDVTVYHRGVHADTSATFEVGEVTQAASGLLKATREALEVAVKACGPGKPILDIGRAIQGVANAHRMQTVRAFIGHGVGKFFHGKPRVYSFAPAGFWDIGGWLQVLLSADFWYVMEPGTTFTIEPILIEPGGSPRFKTWHDGWTVSTVDGSLSAQYEYTVLVQEPGTGEGQGGCEILTPFTWEK